MRAPEAFSSPAEDSRYWDCSNHILRRTPRSSSPERPADRLRRLRRSPKPPGTRRPRSARSARGRRRVFPLRLGRRSSRGCWRTSNGSRGKADAPATRSSTVRHSGPGTALRASPFERTRCNLCSFTGPHRVRKLHSREYGTELISRPPFPVTSSRSLGLTPKPRSASYNPGSTLKVIPSSITVSSPSARNGA